MANASVREAALDALVKVEKNQAYSHLLLNTTLKKAGLNQRDSALLTELVYGTIARRLTLDYYLAPFLNKGKKKRELWVDILLRLSVYQMVFLDRIPDRAVVHEAVTIAKKRGHKGISGLMNGVLRSIQREGLPSIDTIQDNVKRIAVKTSHPEWLIQSWIDQYGEKAALEMAEKNNVPPATTLRVHQAKTTTSDVIEQLANEGVEAEASSLLPQLALIIKSGNPFQTKAYENGLFTAQDEASMLVGLLVDPEANMNVLDACAAPGGKTTHLAEAMQGTGLVFSYDLHAHKVKLIAEQANRLKLKNVKAGVHDARQPYEVNAPFDRVLIDAPCTGLGVIRRKPDIRWTKTKEDTLAIAGVQQAILANAGQYVKTGGTLIYSTCTVDKDENERIVAQFLKAHPQFTINESAYLKLPAHVQEQGRFSQHGLTILPQDFGTDGFFMVSLMRNVTD